MSKSKKLVMIVSFLFCCLAANIAYAESCYSVGSIEYNYTASGCNTITNSRTCCTSGNWSAWGASCSGADNCTSSQCWSGSTCQNKDITSRSCYGNVSNASSGTQTRTATCRSGSGWQYSYWAGSCSCYSGYTWDGSYCSKPLVCSYGRGKGDYVSFCDDEGGCGSDIQGQSCYSQGSETSVCIQIDSRGICRVTYFTCECN